MKGAYQKLSKKYTDKEIAESFVLPSSSSRKEAEVLREEMRRLRQEQRAAMTDQEKMYSALMQLKYQIAGYIDEEKYRAQHSFGSYLKQYVAIIQKSKKELSTDIGIGTSKLNEILSDEREPDKGLPFRLETHSQGLIPALLWWKLIAKKQEYEIRQDKKKRKEEYAKMKNRIRIQAAK